MLDYGAVGERKRGQSDLTPSNYFGTGLLSMPTLIAGKLLNTRYIRKIKPTQERQNAADTVFSYIKQYYFLHLPIFSIVG